MPQIDAKAKKDFERVIAELHGCASTFERSATVAELWGNQMAWEGIVHAFTLAGHPKAARCYAWRYQEDGEWRYVTVLEIPPVDSPEMAVRVAIASKARK